MSTEEQVAKLRKLCDPKCWPEKRFIIEGEVYWFVTDHPLEERMCKVLYAGRMQ